MIVSFRAISQIKTLKGLAFRTHFDHAQLHKEAKGNWNYVEVKKDTEHHNLLSFQLNIGMDLSEYVFLEDNKFYSIIY